ncbi:hypothetical protein [Streptomyces bicolor]|uniref:hypothetical protein n=1 Tax=Streptomyces bicolor TaxID=66874 RepID=UPI001F329F00|nr:hypothetical protein [Streptomyces bicolor]
MSASSPCPCLCLCRGHRVLEAMPGSYEIRPVCWWLAHALAPGPPMTTHIERLVQQLDDGTGPSYDARAELIDMGADALPALIDGLPSLGGFGQLTAIEVFEEVGDPRCGPALIGLLNSDNPTVRECADADDGRSPEPEQ